MIGSFVYAETSKKLKASVEKWRDKGKLMLPEALHISRPVFIPLFAVIFLGVLLGLARYTPFVEVASLMQPKQSNDQAPAESPARRGMIVVVQR